MAPPFRPVAADALRIERTLRNWNREQLARHVARADRDLRFEAFEV